MLVSPAGSGVVDSASSAADGCPRTFEKNTADQGFPPPSTLYIPLSLPPEPAIRTLGDVLARSRIVECTLKLPPRVALSSKNRVVEFERTADTSTAPSARSRANRASAHARGTDGKIAIGRPFHD
jgi:hypothetical protein